MTELCLETFPNFHRWFSQSWKRVPLCRTGFSVLLMVACPNLPFSQKQQTKTCCDELWHETPQSIPSHTNTCELVRQCSSCYQVRIKRHEIHNNNFEIKYNFVQKKRKNWMLSTHISNLLNAIDIVHAACPSSVTADTGCGEYWSVCFCLYSLSFHLCFELRFFLKLTKIFLTK